MIVEAAKYGTVVSEKNLLRMELPIKNENAQSEEKVVLLPGNVRGHKEDLISCVFHVFFVKKIKKIKRLA